MRFDRSLGIRIVDGAAAVGGCNPDTCRPNN